VPGGIGAVLVDRDGEAVDYAGRADAYDLKLAGAHWQIVLRQVIDLATRHSLGALRLVAIRGERRSFIAHVLPDDYVLVLILRKRAGIAPAVRAFAVCERSLAREAGWHAAATSATWFAANVREGRGGRPAQLVVGNEEHSLELLGRLTGLSRRESGWRVRLGHGAELMLVREPGGLWYADEEIAHTLRASAEKA
jgi:hypothetical protein